MNKEKTFRSCGGSGTAPPLLQQSLGLLSAVLKDFFKNGCELFYSLPVHGQGKAMWLAQGWGAVSDKVAVMPLPADPT